VAPPEVLEFIASKISSNIRELEGALIRVTAFASLNRQPVDLAITEIVLKDLFPSDSGPEITAAQIMAAAASYFGVTVEELCGSSRSRVLVTARQIAMYLCRELTDLSLPKIGQAFGGKIVRAPELMHGKTDRIFHDSQGMFAELPNPFIATRYHSLVILPESLPSCLQVSSWVEDSNGNRIIMGVRHRQYAVEGWQFHPESFLTEPGPTLLKRFLSWSGPPIQ
jgi:hypothetical protein